MKIILLCLLFFGISTLFRGIDVSTWEKNIDWMTVAKNNYFAIIRAGYGTSGVDDFLKKIIRMQKQLVSKSVLIGIHMQNHLPML